MADKNAGSVSIRLSVKDAEVVRAALQQLGKEGEASLRRLDAAGKQPTASMAALSDVIGYLRGQVNSSVSTLGVLGDVLLRFGPVGLAAGAALGAVALALSAVSDRVKALREMATETKLGAEATALSVTQYQAFVMVMERQGVSVEQARSALAKFSLESIKAASGQGELFEALRRMPGAYAEEFRAASTGAERLDVFLRARAAGTAEQRRVLDEAATGKSGRLLGTGLNDITNAGGIAALTDSLERAGKVLKEDVIDGLDAAGKKAREKALEASREWDKAAVTVSAGWRKFKASVPGASQDDAKTTLARNTRIISEWVFGPAELDQAKQLNNQIEDIQKKIEQLKLSAQQPRTGVKSWLLNWIMPGFDQNVVDRQVEKLQGQQAKIRKQLDEMKKPASVVVPESAPASAASSTGGPDSDLEKLWVQRERILNNIEKYQRLSTSFAGTDWAARDAASAGKWKQKLDEVNQAIEQHGQVRKRVDGDTTAEGRRQKVTQDLSTEITLERERLGLLGSAATPRERAAQQERELNLAILQRKELRAGDADRVRDSIGLAEEEALAAKRTSLGIVGDKEALSIKLKQLDRDRKDGFIRSEEEMRTATAITAREARENAERLKVRQAANPQLAQLGVDAKNLNKSIDQLGTRSLDSFGDAVADVATKAKTTSQAITDMVTSISRDLIKLVVKKNITGPLAESFSGFDFAKFFSPHAAGGPFNADQMMLVGERGPEVVRFRAGGDVIPNHALPYAMAPSMAAPASSATPQFHFHDHVGGVAVEAQPRSDGGFDLAMRRATDEMAGGVMKGKGSLSRAIAARADNRHLRG